MPSTELWRKLQAVSGLAFASFVFIHLVSHFSLKYWLGYGQSMMKRMRHIYQHPLFEAQLVVAFLVHLTSASVLYVQRKKGEYTRSKKDDDAIQTYTPGSTELQWHRYAGHFLATAIFGHVCSTRIAALLWLPDPQTYDYTFITELQHRIPYHLFTVLLLVLGAAGTWHLLYGVYLASALLMGINVREKETPSFLFRLAFLSNLAVMSTVLVLKGASIEKVGDRKAMQEKNAERDMLMSKMGL